jgi:hypothetical protein
VSSLITITANTTSLQGYQLTSYSDMMSALSYLVGLTSSPYSGQVTYNPTTTAWSLNLYNTHQNTSQTGYVGDWVILQNNTTANICPAAQFSALYTG